MKTLWFAKGGGIARCGPFKSQAEASAAMRLAKPVRRSVVAALLRGERPPPLPTADEFPADVFVWPEVSTPKYKGKALRGQNPERRGK
jgi:hypothetical protein